MTFFEFIQWCFRSGLSGFVTIIVLLIVLDALVRIVAALRGLA